MRGIFRGLAQGRHMTPYLSLENYVRRTCEGSLGGTLLGNSIPHLCMDSLSKLPIWDNHTPSSGIMRTRCIAVLLFEWRIAEWTMRTAAAAAERQIAHGLFGIGYLVRFCTSAVDSWSKWPILGHSYDIQELWQHTRVQLFEWQIAERTTRTVVASDRQIASIILNAKGFIRRA